MNMENDFLGKHIILDNENTYQVIWTTNYNEKTYIYLLNINDYSDVIFAEFKDNSTLRKITQKNELYEIIDIVSTEIARYTK